LQKLVFANLTLKCRHDWTKAFNQLSLWIQNRLTNVSFVSNNFLAADKWRLATYQSRQSWATTALTLGAMT